MEKYFLIGSLSVSVRASFDFVTDAYSARFVIPPLNSPELKIECSFCDELTAVSGDKLFVSERICVTRSRDTVYGTFSSPALGTFMRSAFSDSEPEKVNVIFLTSALCAADMRSIFAAAFLNHRLTEHGNIVLHAACVSYLGESVLFSGPSGIGKSTQAALWNRYLGAEIINGDRCVLLPSKHGVKSAGMPVAGTSGICVNATLPLKAAVILSQSETNRITRVKGLEALRLLCANVVLDCYAADDRVRIPDVLTSVIEQIPVYKFECTPTEEAAEILRRELYG